MTSCETFPVCGAKTSLPNKHSALVLILMGLLLGLAGCGSSASKSGTGTSGVAAPPPTPAGDFSISISPVSVNASPGSVTPSIQVSIVPTGGFSGNVNITASLPAGVSCGSSICSALITAGASLPLDYIVAGTVASGSYTVVFTGSTSTLSHQASLTIEVAAPPAVSPNRSGFVFTGDPIPPYHGALYDKAHDLIYAANYQLCEVEVISPESLQIVKRIPVPSPTAVDLSPDKSILYVGTATQNFFEIATSSLSVVNRVAFQGDPAISEIYPTQIITLADGSLMMVAGCGFINPCTLATAIEVYSPATGTFATPIPSAFAGGLPLPSADRQHIFIVSTDGSAVGRYDVATQAFKTLPLPSGSSIAAVNPDGSGVAALSGCCTIAFLDGNLNSLGSYAFPTGTIFNGGYVYSSDGTRLYVPEGPATSVAINVLDATTFSLLGQIPNLQVDGSLGQPSLFGWDGENRLLGFSDNGVDLVDAAVTPGTLPPAAPGARLGPDQNGTLVLDNPSNGYATTFNGEQFTNTPRIAFNGVPATNVQLSSLNVIDLTAPALQNTAQADVMALFPGGYFLLAPAAYSYKPTILYTDGDASGNGGGGKLTVYGFGFDFVSSAVSVSVGGQPASNATVQWQAGDPFPVPLYSISVTVPPGNQGSADIQVTTPIGTATLPSGFTYAQRTDTGLPRTASPFQMVLDKPRNRLLWTDTVANQIVVYSLNSGSIEQTVSTGSEPAGLSLTPDGSKLLVVLYQSNKLNVYDAGTLALLQQASTPATYQLIGAINPVFIAAVANNKAFLLSTFSGYGGMPVYEYDLASNSFTLRADGMADQSSLEAASGDGTVAFVGGGVWSAATDKFLPSAEGNGDSPRALNADGVVLSEFRAILDQEGRLVGVDGLQNLLLNGMNPIPGQQLNATGSLAYLPETDRIRVFDVRHGHLIKTIMLPDGLSPTAINGLAVDPDGQILYVLTQSGVTKLKFASDPLSIGEVLIAGNQITILGSGFAQGAQVQIDGSSVPSSVQDSQHILLSSAAASAGSHTLAIVLPSGESYSLDDAFQSLDASAAFTMSAARLTGSVKSGSPTNAPSSAAQRVALLNRR